MDLSYLWQIVSELAEPCRSWPPALQWTSLAANALAGLALLSIAASLFTLVRRTRIPYPGLFVVFALCLATSGLGRLTASWATREGASWAVALVGIVAALSSVTAAVCLSRMLPRLVRAVQGLTLSETRRRMLEDYSDELKAVNRLREKEARDFEDIVSSSSDQIYRVNAEGRFEYASPAVTKFFGMPKSELVGKGWDHLTLDEETRRELDETRAAVLDGGREARGSISAPSLEGRRHFDYLCSPIVEKGKVIAVTFNFRDVTEKRNFETELVRAYSEMERRVEQRTEELSASQKRFQDLVNTIDGIVWESDVGHPGFTFVGSQAERITGYPAAKWIGEKRFWQNILHPDDLAKITGDRYVYPDRKKDVQTEYRILTADGRVRWMRDHIRVIFENGRALKMRGIMVDVTEQKKAEEALGEAARVKSEFLANMSHEIRTPLNAIVGMSSLALDCRVDDDARECLATVKTAADSLLTLVNDILDFSKIEAGGVRLELSDFRIRSAVKNAVDVIQPLADERGIRLLVPEQGCVERAVRGDPGRLQQVLLNLLSNAVKFTPRDGQVALDISEGAGSGTVRFVVRDTGVGIAKAAQGELFRPFIQADSSTARKFGGTGLGLSICKRLVELMGGRIGLESSPGEGSTFWFELPFQPAAGMVEAPEEEDPIAPSAGAGRILVADDNPANRKVIRRQLEKLGYTPEVVANGAEALEALEARRFDLVLMDCQMPELDGYEATRRIRARENDGRHTPVVALTAHALAGDRQKCRDSGMDDYLSKPVTLHDLARALARWTRQAPRAAPAADAPAGSPEPPINTIYLNGLSALNGPGQDDIVKELAAIFLDTAGEKLAAIRAAAAAGALDKARFEAHAFKSTSFNVGATRLAKACADLEALAVPETEQAFLRERELLLRRLEKEAADARASLLDALASRRSA